MAKRLTAVSLVDSVSPGPVQVNVTGSVTTNLSETVQNDVTSYSFVSLSADLALNAGAPLALSVTAVTATVMTNWSSFRTWDSGGVLGLNYLFNAGLTRADFIGGAPDPDSLVFWQFAPTVNALQAIGPSNGNRTIPGVGDTTVSGIPISVGATVQLTFDAAIDAGANVMMDQVNVDVSNLTIGSGGTLTAGGNAFTVDDGLINAGILDIVPGAGGSVGQYLTNSGTLVLGGPLAGP